MPRRALVAKEQFARPVTHITSPVLSNEAWWQVGGVLWPNSAKLANLPGLLMPHPKRYCALFAISHCRR